MVDLNSKLALNILECQLYVKRFVLSLIFITLRLQKNQKFLTNLALYCSFFIFQLGDFRFIVRAQTSLPSAGRCISTDQGGLGGISSTRRYKRSETLVLHLIELDYRLLQA